jgi:hypothetical protein
VVQLQVLGIAPENCLQIMEMLGVVTPHGSAALRRVRLHGREREVAAEPKGLEAWTGSIIEKSVENLLLNFATAEILDAARSIPEKDLSLREDSRRHLAAYVADTTVDIDFELHTIIHRCPIWARSISEKMFCPHIARVFMIIDPDRARSALSLIRSALDD